MNRTRFYVAALLVGAAIALLGSSAHAQAISFDALPRANKTDTVAQKSASKPKHVVAKPAPAASHADTVRIAKTDTVVKWRVDTLVYNAAKYETNAAGEVVAKTAAKTAVETAVKSDDKSAVTQFAPTSVSGLLQVMLSGGDSALKSTYRIRRAEVKVVSDLGKKAQAVVMVDVSKALSLTTAGTSTTVTQSSRVLQDAYLVLPAWKLTINAGQQRLPLGFEGANGASSLETVDRALFESDRARGGSFGDVRDLGAYATGKWKWIDYRAGLFNGSGETMNDVDKNVGKTVTGQLAFKPTFVKGLRVGGSAATSGKATGDKPTRDRVIADVVYVRGSALFQAEAAHGQDGVITREGFYVLGGFTVIPQLKIVARFDAWDPNTAKETAAGDVTERDYLVGFTWLPPATRLKAQFAVTRKTYTRDITAPVTLALTQLQASW
jgi:hypothetical protein